MQKLFKLSLLMILATSLVFAGCSSSKKGQCGCPQKQGMIGY